MYALSHHQPPNSVANILLYLTSYFKFLNENELDNILDDRSGHFTHVQYATI